MDLNFILLPIRSGRLIDYGLKVFHWYNNVCTLLNSLLF